MSINPSNIVLTNFYTDAYENLTESSVYANGEMQVMVFPTVNYSESGISDGEIQQIKDYVAENVQIKQMNDDGSSSSVTWEKSYQSNEYMHDINRGGGTKESERATSGIRVPLYFTIPINSKGNYRWYAELEGVSTSKVDPLSVLVTDFSAQAMDFDIYELGSEEGGRLRVIKYTDNKPATHRMLKLTEFRGIKMEHHNSWISMCYSKKGLKACAFPDDLSSNRITVAESYGRYYPHQYTFQNINAENFYNFSLLTKKYGWDDCELFSKDLVKTAKEMGIVCVFLSCVKLVRINTVDTPIPIDILTDKFKAIDNFGNRMELKIDWDIPNDWYWNWAVSDVRVLLG